MIKPGVKGDGRMKIERTVVIETSDIQIGEEKRMNKHDHPFYLYFYY